METLHDQFCRAFVADPALNATRAYQSVYPDSSYDAARSSACELLAKPNIRERITELMRERSARLDIKADDVLRLLWSTVSADPNELVEVRRDCCRHCYGIDHAYQFTPAEWREVELKYQRECQLAEKAGMPLPAEPDTQGGIGYIGNYPPYPDCPECFGRGIEVIHVKDTRTLSPAARQLYAGAKQTRNGLEVLTHSRDKALELIGRHLAMFTDNLDHKNNGGSFQPASLDDFYRLNKPNT
jgi:phage terminase small subunit